MRGSVKNLIFSKFAFLKKMERFLLMLGLFGTLWSNNLYPQSERYTRKSVAFLDALMVTDSRIRLNPEDEKYLLTAIHNGIRIARFDYNPLPDMVRYTFKEQLRAKGVVSESELIALIEATIVPEIVRILDIEKEIRAQNLVDETQRNSFISIKAKELGITADQIEQVMNASYIYLPFLTSYTVSKPKDDPNLTVTIKGGLFWYHIVPGDDPYLESIVTLHTEASGSAEKAKSDAESEAFRLAASTFAINLQVLTRDIEMFKLSAPIAAIEKRTVKFPLGTAEGIKLDDPFFVGEYFQTSGDKITFKKSGFVRVSKVGDNRQDPRQLSAAYAIQKGDWVKGMTMVEHPRVGVDVALKPRGFFMNINEGVFASEDFLIFFDDYDGFAFGADLDFQINIAPLTNKRQSFLVAGATAGVVPVKSELYSTDTFIDWVIPDANNSAGLVYGYTGYMRRFYFGPVAIHGEALIGIQYLLITDKYNDKDVTISNNSLGGRLNLALEYALNIDSNIGIFAGFQAFPSFDWWTIKYGDKEIDVANYADTDKPSISSLSPTFGIYFHYSPPTLSFNPASAFQANGN